ncbi:MAG TPA: AAA family ATPase [Micromonosporaceae bacterium]
MYGDKELAATLGGAPPPTPAVGRGSAATPATAWLTKIQVAGVRGIGPAATLEIAPRAGLTLVVGRNGCGKSSFAGAAELVLTGDSRRWAGRTGVWKEGWRNLHADGDPYIRVGLAIDGHRQRGDRVAGGVDGVG